MQLDKTKYIPKCGDYSIAPSGGITDAILLGVGTQYEKDFAKSIKPLTPLELDAIFADVDHLYWTTKYDGEGCLVYYEEGLGCVCFAAPSGRARIGLPAQQALTKALEKAGVKKALLRGELYLPIQDGKRPGVAGLMHASFSTDPAVIKSIRLALFDVVMLNGKDLREDNSTHGDEWEILGNWCDAGPDALVHRADGGISKGSQLAELFASQLAAGHEGIVVRMTGRADRYKVKPKITVDGVVVGFVEGDVGGLLGVTSLLIGLTHPSTSDGDLLVQTLVRTGTGIPDATRSELHSRLKPSVVQAPVQLNDSDARAVHFVRPDLIVEIEGEDLVENRTDGSPLRSQAFRWNKDEKNWTYAGLAPIPRLVFASYLRLREDKDLWSGGARLEQVLPVPVAPIPSRQPTPPEIIKRQVYQKGDAIRKFLMVRRSEEDAIPYLVFLSDFSASRKEPLKVSLDVAYTQERADALYAASLKENVKKGWDLA